MKDDHVAGARAALEDRAHATRSRVEEADGVPTPVCDDQSLAVRRDAKRGRLLARADDRLFAACTQIQNGNAVRRKICYVSFRTFGIERQGYRPFMHWNHRCN